MYCKYYGLKYKPFELTPLGERVFLSEGHKEALATLRYGVITNKGFLLLTGGVGTGKTTILNALLRMLKDTVTVCILNNPTLSKHEFFSYLSQELGIPYQENKATFILNFANFLKDHAKKGTKVLLIFDEAQAFPLDLLEEIRLLSNHAGENKALSIFLIGQPELQEKLADPLLLPLRQRIGLRHHLEPLSAGDTTQYIAHRLNQAGAANSAIFSNNAVSTIHKKSSGNPRLINIICDHAMVSGFNHDLRSINKKIIEECIQEIKLQNETMLQVSGRKKQPHIGIKIFGITGPLAKTLAAVTLVTLTLTLTLTLAYKFAPHTWWQYLSSISTQIFETLK
ncbi:MAG: AAA family ATPase [Desulfotalea sp.]|nr:MAG: AAA family ATPase [Desulfotalea sp.]